MVEIKTLKLKWALYLCLLLIVNSAWPLRLLGFLFLSTNIPIFWCHHDIRLRCHCDIVLYCFPLFFFLLSLFSSIGINPFLHLLNATACFMKKLSSFCLFCCELKFWNYMLTFCVHIIIWLIFFFENCSFELIVHFYVILVCFLGHLFFINTKTKILKNNKNSEPPVRYFPLCLF